MKVITNPISFEMEYRNRKTGEIFIIDLFTPYSLRDEEDEAILWSAVKKIEKENGKGNSGILD